MKMCSWAQASFEKHSHRETRARSTSPTLESPLLTLKRFPTPARSFSAFTRSHNQSVSTFTDTRDRWLEWIQTVQSANDLWPVLEDLKVKEDLGSMDQMWELYCIL